MFYIVQSSIFLRKGKEEKQNKRSLKPKQTKNKKKRKVLREQGIEKERFGCCYF